MTIAAVLFPVCYDASDCRSATLSYMSEYHLLDSILRFGHFADPRRHPQPKTTWWKSMLSQKEFLEQRKSVSWPLRDSA